MNLESLNPFPRRGAQQFGKLCGVLLVVIGFTACSSDVADADGDAGLSDADEVSADTEADAADTRDAENGDPTEDNGDGGTDPNDNDGEEEWTTPDWEECDCDHPEDECSHGRCGRPGIECGPGGEECPDGYSCWSDGGAPEIWYCRCDGSLEECGPYCETHDDCPGTCNDEEGVCRPGGGCLHDMECPDGRSCIEYDGDDSTDRLCYETGDREPGESCDADIECSSGMCDDGECVEQCLTNDDCDEGEACTELASYLGETGDGCEEVEGTAGECTTTCEEGERCLGDQCLAQFCETTDDCEEGDCKWQGLMHPGECEKHPGEDEDRVCKPEEYRDTSDDTCILPGPCWSDEDCGGEPYECVSNTCKREIDDGGPS